MEVTSDLLLRAYSCGLFPMSECAEDETLFWLDPDLRGIIPLETFHIPRSLKKILRKGPFDIRCNTNFSETIKGCAERTENRRQTWISGKIIELYEDLFKRGFAHSIECWEEDQLVGGLYGVHIGAAFFGESMFSRKTHASKIALVHLVARLKQNGFRLLDTQFVTTHLSRFGAYEIPRKDYQQKLIEAINEDACFERPITEDYWLAFLQSTTQTS